MYHIGTLLVKIICEIRFFYVSRYQKQILCLSKLSGIINGLWTVVIRGGGVGDAFGRISRAGGVLNRDAWWGG